MPLVQHTRTLKPLKATALATGNIRFDFAENFVGVTQLDAAILAQAFQLPTETTSAGTATYSIQHCEKYNSTSGEVICDLTGDAGGPNGQRDTYVNAPANSTLLPRFTWHGFQFVEVNVANATATHASVAALGATILDAVTGLEVRTDIDQTGTVQVDAGKQHILNSIQTILTNSQKGNVAAYMPTDCPTREKHGWLGDAQVTAEEAMLNYNMAPM